MPVKIERKVSGKSFQELLMEKFQLSEEDLKKLQAESLKQKKSIIKLLHDLGYSEDEIASLKAEYFGFKFDKLSNYHPPEIIKKLFDKDFLKNRLVLPLSVENSILVLAMSEPSDIITINSIVDTFRKSGYDIQQVSIIVSTSKQIEEKIESIYREEEQFFEQILNLIKVDLKEEQIEEKKLTETSSPIIMLANKIIEDAYLNKASDIHIQPLENKTVIRYRIDGDLNTFLEIPKFVHEALVTRIKIMSDLRIDEKRMPQDGRIDFTKYRPDINIDLRVSTLPTIYGEDIVMRILSKSLQLLELEKLGFTEENLRMYREAINKPYGMILHTGPTGSGKTTTLYAALNEVNKPDVKIVTVEDPVEYTLGGTIVQTSVNLEAGYTFAKALKAFLRHDPDIILVGEIRDLETAKIAVEASLTGHLVFSTLHTNDAISTVTRLKEMGIESYLLADSLLIIVAQRLAKKICQNCKKPYKPSKREALIIEKAGFSLDNNILLYRGEGCVNCNFTGYKGRVGLHELLYIDDNLKSVLVESTSIEDFKREAIKSGMKTLRQDALIKALNGITTIEEVEKNTI